MRFRDVVANSSILIGIVTGMIAGASINRGDEPFGVIAFFVAILFGVAQVVIDSRKDFLFMKMSELMEKAFGDSEEDAVL